LEGRRKFKAVITSVEGDLIHLTSSETDEEWQISLDNIDKANLVPEL
jgi:ribosome maturation factor RimP